MEQQNWYSITAKAAEEADVMIYSEIGGFGIKADTFVKDLKGIKAKTINVHMNTGGGGVFDGLAIYNALKAHPAQVVMHIDGLAASIGSIIAMAGDEIRIAKNAYMMIHNPAGIAMGDAADMRKMAATLEKMRGTMAQTYADRTGQPKEHWLAQMTDESWYTAEEAKAEGLADTIVDDPAEAMAIAASFDLSVFKNLPERLKAQAQSVSINSLGRVNPASRDAGTEATITEFKMNDDLFKKYAAENPESAAVKAMQVQGRNAGIAEAHSQEIERLKALTAACPNRPQLAINAFLSGQDAEAVKMTVGELDREATAQKAENDRLKADLAKAQFNAGTQGAVATILATGDAAALAATGGNGAAKPQLVKDRYNKPTPESCKALAEWEWANENPPGFSSKESYVAVRTAEFTGQLKTHGRTLVEAN